MSKKLQGQSRYEDQCHQGSISEVSADTLGVVRAARDRLRPPAEYLQICTVNLSRHSVVGGTRLDCRYYLQVCRVSDFSYRLYINQVKSYMSLSLLTKVRLTLQRLDIIYYLYALRAA